MNRNRPTLQKRNRTKLTLRLSKRASLRLILRAKEKQNHRLTRSLKLITYQIRKLRRALSSKQSLKNLRMRLNLKKGPKQKNMSLNQKQTLKKTLNPRTNKNLKLMAKMKW